MSRYPGYPNATHYTPNFTKAELRCRCGCTPSREVDANLAVTAEHLEQLRTFHGGPLTVNDGHRCPEENARVGGVKDSQHLYGRAADLDAGGTDAGVDALAAKATGVPAFRDGGIGKYYSGHGWFVHADWRGYVARWQMPEAA